MGDFDGPGRGRRQAGPGPVGPQRARSTAPRSPTTAGSAPACRPSRRSPTPAPGSSSIAHLGRPKGEPDGQLLAAPGRRAARRAARRRRRLRDRHGRGVGARDRRRPRPTARSRCWRTSGSTPARPARTTPSAVRSPTSSPAWPTRSSPTASASCTASRPRLRRRAAAAARHGRAGRAPRSRCCSGSPRTPSGPTSSCSAARRSPTSSA